jgi:nitroreductase
MDILTAIHTRRAVRDYLDRPIAGEVLAALIDAAIWAPSGVNLQPWSFYVVEGRGALASFSAKAKAHIQRSAAEHPELTAVRGHLASPSFNIFYNAPALVLICATTPDEMALKDCCLAAENLMLAATAAGLGTCWIGFSEAWLATDEAKAELGIPAAYRPVAPVILGYPSGAPPAPARRAAEVHHVGEGARP